MKKETQMAKEEPQTIFQKLSTVQQELKVPKAQTNTFGNYKYRSCEDILEEVKPILATLDLVLTLTDELVSIGQRYYVKATASLTDIDSPDTQFTITAFAREEETKKGMDSSQITGAASSYARKYALNGLFLIDDVRDSDATNDGGNNTTEGVKQTSSKNYEFIGEKVEWNGTTWQRIKGIGKTSGKPYDLYFDQNKNRDEQQKPIDPDIMASNLRNNENEVKEEEFDKYMDNAINKE